MSDDFRMVLAHNISFLDSSIQTHMPEGAYRHFYQWALSEANPHRDLWLQVSGLRQLVRMAYELLHELVSDDQVEHLAYYSMVMTSYLVFETVSDNLGIGLVHPDNHHIRRHMTTFNDAMLARLCDDQQTWRVLMSNLASDMQVSGFDQSLSPHKHMVIAEEYVRQHAYVTLRELEYGLFPSLVANIETCKMLYDQCNLLIGGHIVQDGLRARYESINRLIHKPHMPLDERIEASTDAILVVPTLGYYIAVLANGFYQLPHFADVVANPALHDALREAALIVRLLNDIGMLTRLSSDETDRVLQTLADEARANETINDVIIRSTIGADMTRLQKDAQHGEFNLALAGISDLPISRASLDALRARLARLREAYVRGYANMEKALLVIDTYPQHDFIRTLLYRFVHFHERMYAQSYRTEVGEYAV
jgi:hypothetical protein